MLETIRGYGHEQLREAGEYELLHRRHADWYQRLVSRASAEWISHRQAYWQASMTREHPNLRAAINYCLDDPDQADTALHLTTTVPLAYWSRRGLFSEVRRWMDRALTQVRTPSAVCARALLLDSHYAFIQGDGEVAMQLLNLGEDLARQLGSTVELAYAAYVRGVVWLYRGDLLAAIEAMESTQQVLSTVPQPEAGLAPELQLCQLLTLGLTTGLVGDNQRAESCVADVLAITEACGENHFRYYALWAQALSAWGQGKVHETLTSLVAALRLRQAEELADRSGVARCIEMMAWVAANQQQYQRAAVLLGAADALWTETGQPITVQGHVVGAHEECDRLARAGLGEAAFTDAVARGQSLSYNDAIAYALNEQRHPKAQPSPEAPSPLTRRERQVAALITEGMSNKEIAAKLVISHRTAESHVEHILTKLGATSRAQVAAWTLDPTAHDSG